MTSTELSRSTLTISAWNSVSRLTGFVRVLAVGAAVGTTYLGNTYQSSNLVSNLLFEILASGLLSAPLVPAFVGLLDRGDKDGAEGLAGSLLGLSLVGLGVVVVLCLLARTAIMHVLTVGVDDPTTRDAQVRLGAFFLWFFLPQVLLYAVGAVASALLNASRRFAAAAFAPVANNVAVTATMAAYIAMRDDATPSLGLPLSEKLLLAIGTTAGVLFMSAVPVLALWRAGYRLRPRLDLRDPRLRSIARVGAWGAVMLAAAQLLIGVTLVLANRVEGGVVAYSIAYTFFLLPHAVIAHPVYTALYPRLSAHVHAGDRPAFRADVADGVRRMAMWVLPASLALMAAAPLVLRVLDLGAIDEAGAAFVGRVVVAYALGLVGYSVFQLLARAATAMGNVRLPALIGVGMTLGGAVLMVVGSSLADGRDKVVALGVAHSVAVTLGAAVMWALPWRRA